MKIIKIILLSVSILILLYSCEKSPGEGGTSTIVGKVYAINYNSELTTILSEYYAADENVFIIYGDDTIYNDDFKTHYDGSYRFEYLREGKYTIFVYSKDTLEPSGYRIVEKEVVITEKNQTIIVDDLVIIH